MGLPTSLAAADENAVGCGSVVEDARVLEILARLLLPLPSTVMSVFAGIAGQQPVLRERLPVFGPLVEDADTLVPDGRCKNRRPLDLIHVTGGGVSTG